MPLLSQINCLQQLQVQFGAINNMNKCYMKMSTVVYSIKQQQKIMCFLLPVDSKPTADKMSKIKTKSTFEIEQCWIFAVLWWPFWKWRSVEIFRCRGINSGHHNLPIYEISLKSNNVEFVRYCGGHFENGRNQFGTSLSTHISNFDDIGQCWIFTADFLCRVLAAILKMQNCSSNGDLSLC